MAAALLSATLAVPAGAETPASTEQVAEKATAFAVISDSAAIERERLAAIERQLVMLRQLIAQAQDSAPQDRARYYFDYERLSADIEQVLAGLHDYMSPQRAQPRDVQTLAGQYTSAVPVVRAAP
jgi:RAQPRD family integrative conjugative element protein